MGTAAPAETQAAPAPVAVSGRQVGGLLADVRGKALEALRSWEAARRFAAGVVLSGLHQTLCTLVLAVGLLARDPLALGAVTLGAVIILALDVLLETCPLSVMEEERWGVSSARLTASATEWLLGARSGQDAYSVQMQYIVVCCAALAVRLLLLLLGATLRDRGPKILSALNTILF